MILLELWRRGLLRRLDREKLAFFFGLTGDPLTLSRRYPPWLHLDWLGLLLSPTRARAAAAWLEYRLDLFDGLQG